MSEVEALIARALGGEECAWVRVIGELWDRVERQVGASPSMGQLRGSVDDRREVVSLVFARLRRSDFRALRTLPAWRERNPVKTFDDWLGIVVGNVIRDHVGRRLGHVDTDGAGNARLVNTLAETLEGATWDRAAPRIPITARVTAAALLAHAEATLPADQYAALAHWVGGDSLGEIATELGAHDAAAVRARIRAALARLRRSLRSDLDVDGDTDGSRDVVDRAL